MKTEYLNEVAEIRAGNSAPQGEEPFNNGRYNFYRTFDVGQVKKGEISESRDKVNKETYSNLKTFQINTILFPKSGASTFNNNRVIIKEEGAIASHLAGIKANPEVLNDYYLYYFLLTIDAKNLVQDSAYPSVNLKQISQIKIPVPSLQEQEEIVERLDKVFKTIDRLLSNGVLKKKLYIDYYESITWNELIENPNFPKNRISNFFELDPSKSEIANENLKDVSFIPMADVKELSFQVEGKQVKKFEEVKKGYKYFADGDFVLAKITPCFENGKMGEVNNLVNGVGFGSTEFIVHRSNGKMLNEWLFLIYSNTRIRKKLAITMSGAVGHKRVSKDTISNFQINSPDLNQQKKVIDKLFEVKQAIDKKISIFNQEIINLELLKKSILNKEFSYE